MRLLDLAQVVRPVYTRIAVLFAALLAAAALNLPATTPARAQSVPLKFSLDWRFEGPSALFILPQEKGYFRHEGLDVTVDEATTSLEAITRVASGAYDIGFADINTLIRYRDQNPTAPIKAVFMVYNKPPFSIVGRKSRGISDPKSLEGKKLGAPYTSSTYAQWRLFAKLNDLDPTKIAVENIAVPVREPMLAAGQLDAVLGYSFRVYVDLKDRGVPVDDLVLLQMANYGLKLYGAAIVVNSKLATEKPEAVRGFLRAYMRGLRDTIRSPVGAIDALLKRGETAKKDVELERLRMALRENILTPEVRANGFGAIDNARFEQGLDQLALVSPFKTRPKIDDLFDASFLPPATDRKTN
jgi:NitT/TauT family transport system substrate-binding protein